MELASYDVLVVGGGLSGLSAAIFLARADLKTVVFDTGASTIQPISMVNNYLGFPEGIPGAELLERGRTQARRFGVELRAELVQQVRRLGDGTYEAVAASGSYGAPIVLVASNKNTKVGADLGLKLGGRNNRFIEHDGAGRTTIPKVYVCGRITEHPSQAAISVGNGALVALTIIQDVRGAYYVDHDD
ncbi:MAG TPA: NAD(P)/FAD-dependent oxidoreductase [Candidatus Thermoplasmatota archaeon]